MHMKTGLGMVLTLIASAASPVALAADASVIVRAPEMDAGSAAGALTLLLGTLLLLRARRAAVARGRAARCP